MSTRLRKVAFLIVILSALSVEATFAQLQRIKSPRVSTYYSDLHYGRELAFVGDLLVVGSYSWRDGFDVYRGVDGTWTLIDTLAPVVDGRELFSPLASSTSMLLLDTFELESSQFGIAVFAPAEAGVVLTQVVPAAKPMRFDATSDDFLLASSAFRPDSVAQARLWHRRFLIYRVENGELILDGEIERPDQRAVGCLADESVVLASSDATTLHMATFDKENEVWSSSSEMMLDGPGTFREWSCWEDRLAVLTMRHASVFVRSDNGWMEEHRIHLSDGAYPWSVELRGDWLAVSYTQLHPSSVWGPIERGSVIVHRRDELGWRQVQILDTPNPPEDFEQNDGLFGLHLSMSDRFLAVAAPFRNGEWFDSRLGEWVEGFHRGEVYVYGLDNIDLVGQRTKPDRLWDLTQSRVYPNPASDKAALELTLPIESFLRLSVYDVLGRTVVRLADGAYQSGPHIIEVDVSELPSGVYYVVGTANSKMFSQTSFIVQ